MYCSGCGTGMSRAQWTKASYCWRCGQAIQREVCGMSGAVRVRRVLVQVRGTASRHPWMSSLGAVGIGSGCIMAAPLLMSAGQSLVWIGLVIAGVCAFMGSKEQAVDLQGGVKAGGILSLL